MNRKMILWAASAALASASASAQTLLNMSETTLDAFDINGALFRTSKDAVTVSGTGVYNTFLALSDDNDVGRSAEGFNSDSTNLMPDVDNAKTHALLGSDLTTVTNLGQPADVLFGFGADINEPASNGNEYISVDQLQVWVRPVANGDIDPANTYATLSGAAGAIKVWDLDDDNLDGIVDNNRSILFNYLLASSGSGRSDLLFILPDSVIKAKVPTFANNNQWYIYLFTRMGDVGTTFNAARDYGENSGGFEEWQTVGGLTLLPESSTYAAMGVVGLAAAGVWRRSRRSKA